MQLFRLSGRASEDRVRQILLAVIEEKVMGAFISSFIGYVVEMACMVALGLCGGYAGYKLRQRKNAKLAGESAES